MSEASRKWRCPYCDGLNDWQNTVCEICGDGRRDETLAAEKTAEIPKTYTPQPSKNAEEEVKREENAKATRAAYAPPPPPAPKKKGKLGLLIAVVVVALGALGGRFLADSYVKSVEANKLTPTPMGVIETAAPVEATAEEPASVEQQPAAVEQPEATPQPQATEAPQAEPAVLFDTVTDNHNGTATIKLKINQPADKYNIYWYCLGPDKEAESFIQYQPNGVFGVWPRDMTVVDAPKNTVTLDVIPGCYTAFFVNAATGFESSEYWVSEPYYFEETKDAPPFTVTDIKFLKWRSNDDWNDSWSARNAGDTRAIRGYTDEYTFTSAQALNDLLRRWADRESKDFLGEEIVVELTDDSMYSLNWNKQHYDDPSRPSFSELLSGPGFHVMNFIDESPMTEGTHYTFLSVFHDEYRLLEKFGGYPPGDYTLDLFYCGYKVYTMQFTLAGEGGATASNA